MISREAKKQRQPSKIMRAPIRVMSKAISFYIKFMEKGAANMSLGGVVPFVHVPQPSTIARSFSVSSSKEHEDVVEHLRSAVPRSASLREGKMNMHLQRVAEMRHSSIGLQVSDRIGRIDEESACCFEEDFVCPISRSCAVQRSSLYCK